MPADFEAHAADATRHAGRRLTTGSNAVGIRPVLDAHSDQGVTPMEIARRAARYLGAG